MDEFRGAEYAIEAMPPSIPRAAAVLLFNAFWQLTDKCPASANRAENGGGWSLIHSLPCLRPHVTGDLARALDCVADNPTLGMEAIMDLLGKEI